MVTATNKGYIALSLGDVMKAGLKNPETAQNTDKKDVSFNEQLNNAFVEPERFWVDGTPASRQESGTATNSGQIAGAASNTLSASASLPPGAFMSQAGLITYQTAADVAPNTMDRLPSIGADTANRKFTDYEDPTPKVQSELQKLGIDPSGMKFQRWDDEISNWGGHYTNHSLRVDLGNGVSEDFSIEWTLRNPSVTANEIARLLKSGGRVS